ncbi:hypothetical protein LAJ19_20530 (plasmid) [Deinococcus taeanensis]|uniref:hypothetical protein n=1 Tax=Deinococcus taeanensis TaxID=2737050 RepID=UPI001CDBC8E3|nr:hypothetical protein [Deinococcus taeanensis]UBV45197.1 hypothetical protein LAJ19_20530 [Deinococcus taeanensis]
MTIPTPPHTPPPADARSARLTAPRKGFDTAIEALANTYARLERNGHHCWTEPSGGHWPSLLVEGRAGPHQIVTFRGFGTDVHLTIPRERFDAFWAEALAHQESSPALAYDWQEDADA